jgi:hypothetical protein
VAEGEREQNKNNYGLCTSVEFIIPEITEDCGSTVQTKVRPHAPHSQLPDRTPSNAVLQ